MNSFKLTCSTSDAADNSFDENESMPESLSNNSETNLTDYTETEYDQVYEAAPDDVVIPEDEKVNGEYIQGSVSDSDFESEHHPVTNEMANGSASEIFNMHTKYQDYQPQDICNVCQSKPMWDQNYMQQTKKAWS